MIETTSFVYMTSHTSSVLRQVMVKNVLFVLSSSAVNDMSARTTITRFINKLDRMVCRIFVILLDFVENEDHTHTVKLLKYDNMSHTVFFDLSRCRYWIYGKCHATLDVDCDTSKNMREAYGIWHMVNEV